MAKALNKTLQLQIDATKGVKTLEDLKKRIADTQTELGGLTVGSTDFEDTLSKVKLLENGLTSITKSASESALQIADFAKTAGEAFFQTVSIIGLYTSSTDEASLITAKLANIFALVGTAEKAFQAISQGTVLYQELKAELALKEAAALALNTEAIVVNTTVEASNTVGTVANTAAQTAQTSSLFTQIAAWAILNPLTAIAATAVVGLTSAYFILTKSVTDIIEKQDKENKRLKETNDALIGVKEASLELVKARKLLNNVSLNQAEIEFRIDEANLLRENIALQEVAFAREKQQLEDIQKTRSEGFARLRRDIFGENADTLIALQEKENAIKESEARITQLRAKEIQKRKDIENEALDNDRKISKARQDQALEQLSTETSIFAKRQSVAIEYASAIEDLDNELAKGKITQSERNRAAFLEEDKLRSKNIELLREERNQALEARNITREGIIKDLETKNDIASQFLIIQLEQQQAEDELATAILNKEIPAIQQSVKQQEIKNETLRKNVKLQEQINALLLESERNTAILQLEEITRKLNEATGDFVKDYTNDLKIIEAESIEANEKIRVEFEKRFKEAGDNPELKKALKTELDAALSNAKSIEEAKKKERKKGFVVEIEEENVKNVAIEELQKGFRETITK